MGGLLMSRGHSKHLKLLGRWFRRLARNKCVLSKLEIARLAGGGILTPGRQGEGAERKQMDIRWMIFHILLFISYLFLMMQNYISYFVVYYTPTTKLRRGILDSPYSSLRPSVRRRCPDDNLNSFHRISIFFDLCITWVKILDKIEHEHHTWLNMCIMAGHVT